MGTEKGNFLYVIFVDVRLLSHGSTDGRSVDHYHNTKASWSYSLANPFHKLCMKIVVLNETFNFLVEIILFEVV